MKREQVLGLDLIRFAAALLVVAFHLTYWIWYPVESTPKRITEGVFDFSGFSTSFGWVGVQIFFVLSGFVIAYSAAFSNPWSFLRGRILRLAPAAWVCATITLLVGLSIGDMTIVSGAIRWTRSVLFVPFGEQIDGVYWTLGIEIAFYSLVLLLLLVKRFAWIEGVAAILALVSTTFWLTWAFGPSDLIAALAKNRIVMLLLIRHGAEFALGVMLWLILIKGPTSFRIAISALCLLGGSLEIVATAHTFAASPAWWVPLGVWFLALAAIGGSVHWNGLLTRWLGRWSSTVRLLGLATYPLYLIHQLVGAAIMFFCWKLGVPAIGCLAIAVIAVFVITVLVCKVAEPAIGRLLYSGLQRIEQRVSAIARRRVALAGE